MVYEIYGIHAVSGSNCRIGRVRNMVRAYAMAKDINPTLYQAYAIVKRERVASLPLSITTGKPGHNPLRDMSLVTPIPNPIHDPYAGSIFWAHDPAF